MHISSDTLALFVRREARRIGATAETVLHHWIDTDVISLPDACRVQSQHAAGTPRLLWSFTGRAADLHAHLGVDL